MIAVKKIRLLVVDDHPVVREGLRSMISNFKPISLIGICAGGAEALEMAAAHALDVMLIDLRMSPMNGIELMRRTRALHPRIKCIILSSYELEEEVHQAIEAGARGYLSKDLAPSDILSGILEAHAGKLVFPPHLLESQQQRSRRPALTLREHSVLELMAKGLTNKEIARVAGVSQFTIRNQISSITRKLEVADRTEAVHLALELGILTL